MKPFARKTENLIKLTKQELSSKVHKLDDCVVTLEKSLEQFLEPAKRGWFQRLFGQTHLDWFEGTGIANCGAVLTEYLDDKEQLEYQSRSAKVWATATLRVCGHYHHMVGPAMVANAKIAEKLGKTDDVKEICSAVVQDFTEPLGRCETFDHRPEAEEEDYESIKAMEFAVNKLIELGEDDKWLRDFKRRIENLWSKPAYEEG